MTYRLREEPDFAVLTVEGKLTRADYERFLPEFERLAQRRGKVPMLIDITQMEGWSPAAVWEDLKFDVSHQDQMGPMAVLGDAAWEKWMVKLTDVLFKPDVDFFPADRVADARQWLSKRAKAMT